MFAYVTLIFVNRHFQISLYKKDAEKIGSIHFKIKRGYGDIDIIFDYLFEGRFYPLKKLRYHRLPFGRAAQLSLPYGSLAQLVEQWIFNPLVAGSNPARPTIPTHFGPTLNDALSSATNGLKINELLAGC